MAKAYVGYKIADRLEKAANLNTGKNGAFLLRQCVSTAEQT